MKIYKIYTIVFLLVAQVSIAQNITLEDVFTKHIFSPKGVYGLNSMNNGVNYTTNIAGEKIVKWSYKTGEQVSVVFNIEEIADAPIKYFRNYKFDASESKILIIADIEMIYRHSYKANNYVYDINTKTLKPISEQGKQQLATFSPDGTKVAFVRNNNLFYVDLSSQKEIQITTDGEWNKIINGASDWVYEEEFSFAKAFAWSPDSKKIAFYKFDESAVRLFNLTMYDELYPTLYSYKYPKAGEDNSIVTLNMYNLENKKSLTIDIGSETDQYIPRIKWTADANILSFYRLNRLQNKLELLFADAETGKSKVIFTEENKYYLEINDDLTFLEDGKHFIYNGIMDGYQHLYLFTTEGKLVRQITKGKWNVTGYEGYNPKTKTIYYVSTETSPLERNVYAIGIDGTKKQKLSTKNGFNSSSFSKGYKYYINYFSDANTPSFITLHNSKGKQIRVLEDNQALKDTIQKYKYAKKELFNFKTTEGVDLNAWMIKPNDFDASKKYPVFMYVYGGPGSQSVQNRWGYRDAWYQLIAQNGYIVVCVDNRGTGYRDEMFTKITYQQLGKYETIDQIEAAKYLGNLDYVDASRIGIFGWSYGGYMSSLSLFNGADVFKMAIAVAPVTNWRNYDNVYTERYMRKPQDNADGYDLNSPINHVEKLKGKFLLIHGSADDNVHFQNTMELVIKLVESNKQFDLFVYPNKNHFINGGNTNLHIYTKMTNFILENL